MRQQMQPNLGGPGRSRATPPPPLSRSSLCRHRLPTTPAAPRARDLYVTPRPLYAGPFSSGPTHQCHEKSMQHTLSPVRGAQAVIRSRGPAPHALSGDPDHLRRPSRIPTVRMPLGAWTRPGDHLLQPNGPTCQRRARADHLGAPVPSTSSMESAHRHRGWGCPRHSHHHDDIFLSSKSAPDSLSFHSIRLFPHDFDFLSLSLSISSLCPLAVRRRARNPRHRKSGRQKNRFPQDFLSAPRRPSQDRILRRPWLSPASAGTPPSS